MNSQSLVERTQQGDPEALEELLNRHLPGVRAYVRLRMNAMLRARESATDIVQSTCVDVLSNLSQFRFGSEAGFKAWLYNAALRKIADRAEYWHASRRDPAREQHHPISAHDDSRVFDVYRTICSPSKEAIAHEVMERIERAFEKLAEDHREVILLSRVVGLSHAEIGERMGRSEAAARALLYRALSLLSALLHAPRESGDHAASPNDA